MRMLIFGHGYSAGFLTPVLRDRGWDVVGTTRGDPDRLRAAGAEPLIWPGKNEDAVRAEIARADAILCSVGPSDGDPVLNDFRNDIMTAKPGWIGYLSTTGIYGDHEGGWVDEDTPPDPTTARGRARQHAEAMWQSVAAHAGAPLHIFRLAGIYGPGRGPFAKLRAGTARCIVKPGQVFSRIHGVDIATTVAAALDHREGGIWNVCDDEPAPPQDVIAHAAALLGLPAPPEEDFETAEMSPMARSFYSDSKRVRNDRIKEILGVRLRYPDYRSGLAAVLADEMG